MPLAHPASKLVENLVPKMTIVGEAPSKTGEGKPPFDGKSGDLFAMLLGFSGREELRSRVHLVNVFDFWPGPSRGKGSDFPLHAAWTRAKTMTLFGTVLFAGMRVAAAFGHPRARYFEAVSSAGLPAYAVPHPSGVNRWWNSPGNRSAAQIFFRILSEQTWRSRG